MRYIRLEFRYIRLVFRYIRLVFRYIRLEFRYIRLVSELRTLDNRLGFKDNIYFTHVQRILTGKPFNFILFLFLNKLLFFPGL